jgi:hypothetical protein
MASRGSSRGKTASGMLLGGLLPHLDMTQVLTGVLEILGQAARLVTTRRHLVQARPKGPFKNEAKRDFSDLWAVLMYINSDALLSVGPAALRPAAATA